MTKKSVDKKAISVRLRPDIADKLAEFQAQYWYSSKKRISQSETINIALEYFINETYKTWDALKDKANGTKSTSTD